MTTLLARFDGVFVHLDRCAAVLQVIALLDGLQRKFSFFTDRHERFVQIVSNRHTENEAAGLGSADYITVYFFYKMLHLIYGKLQSVCVLQDTRYISENNTRFREIRNTSYVILYFFHKIFLRFVKV